MIANHDELVKKVEGFAHLPVNWDTYESRPPSPCAIKAALLVLRSLDNMPVEYSDTTVVPTGDSSIMIGCRTGTISFKWECDPNGDIGKVRVKDGDDPEYTEVITESQVT